MEDRKIEAWTGPVGLDPSKMIGALVQAPDGSIKQIDDRLLDALGDHKLDGTPDLAVDLLALLHNGGYPNAHLEFPRRETTHERTNFKPEPSA